MGKVRILAEGATALVAKFVLGIVGYWVFGGLVRKRLLVDVKDRQQRHRYPGMAQEAIGQQACERRCVQKDLNGFPPFYYDNNII